MFVKNFSRKRVETERFFMKTIRRTRIKLETHELTTIRISRKARFFCGECLTQTDFLSVGQTAKILSVSEKTIFRLAEIEQIHSTETSNGQLLICADSAISFEKHKERLSKNGQIGK